VGIFSSNLHQAFGFQRPRQMRPDDTQRASRECRFVQQRTNIKPKLIALAPLGNGLHDRSRLAQGRNIAAVFQDVLRAGGDRPAIAPRRITPRRPTPLSCNSTSSCH
jgi:hypothetical protein